jgi:penicillin-binding protein 1A
LSTQKPRKKKKSAWSVIKKIFLWTGLLVLMAGALAGGIGLGALYWMSQGLPRIERLADYRPPAVTQVLANDGSLMVEYYHQRRYVVPISEIPPLVCKAFVSAEDGNFYNHPGVDIWGIARAFYVNFKAGRTVQGASTITQQVAKMLLLTPKRTWERKIKEAILAYRMEKYLSKDEILYLYLNHIYLGHGAHGIEAAAQIYFGKHSRNLNLAEAALLAGLIKAPSRYSPIRHPRRARTRQAYVISRMLEEGYLNKDQARAALNQNLDIRIHRKDKVDAPYYQEYVRQWLQEKFGRTQLYEGGLTVITACDPNLTKYGQEAIEKGLYQLTKRQGFRGPKGVMKADQLKEVMERPILPAGLEAGQEVSAVVTRVSPNEEQVFMRMGNARGLLDPVDAKWVRQGRNSPGLEPGNIIDVRLDAFDTDKNLWQVSLSPTPSAQAAILAIEAATGRVKAMIGGRDFWESQYNRAVQAHRQPGSAFKPFIFSAALDHPVQKWNPATVVLDSPVVYEDPGQPGEKWKPKNYENRFYGPTTLRTALEHSRNVVTVKILSALGMDYTIDYIRRFGIQSPLTPNLSLALGTSGVSLLELTQAYSVFVNQGVLVEPVCVEKVIDRHGQVIYEANPHEEQVIPEQTSFLVTHLLRGVVENGTGRKMKQLNRPVAGKTGTTNDLRDAWFLGFSPQLVCGVWVGQDDNKPLGRRETGARAAGPIWLEFMKDALKNLPPMDFPVPEGVVFARIDHDTGRAIPTGNPGGFFEAFKAGTEPGPQDMPVAGGEATTPRAEDFLQAETFAPAPAPPEQN